MTPADSLAGSHLTGDSDSDDFFGGGGGGGSSGDDEESDWSQASDVTLSDDPDKDYESVKSSEFGADRFAREGMTGTIAFDDELPHVFEPNCPSTFCKIACTLFFQIERAALHSYGPDPHSC